MVAEAYNRPDYRYMNRTGDFCLLKLETPATAAPVKMDLDGLSPSYSATGKDRMHGAFLLHVYADAEFLCPHGKFVLECAFFSFGLLGLFRSGTLDARYGGV